MALKKKPVNGMKDIMPDEMQIRDYVQSVIKETYRAFGFTPIETPCMEDIANLSNKQGGENEKLIFKVLKRGEKLKLETAQSEADLVDFGMRYLSGFHIFSRIQITDHQLPVIIHLLLIYIFLQEFL